MYSIKNQDAWNPLTHSIHLIKRKHCLLLEKEKRKPLSYISSKSQIGQKQEKREMLCGEAQIQTGWVKNSSASVLPSLHAAVIGQKLGQNFETAERWNEVGAFPSLRKTETLHLGAKKCRSHQLKDTSWTHWGKSGKNWSVTRNLSEPRT